MTRNIALFLEHSYLNRYDIHIFEKTCFDSDIKTGQWTMGSSEFLTSENLEKFDYFIILSVDEKDIDFISGLFAGRSQEKPKIFIIGILG